MDIERFAKRAQRANLFGLCRAARNEGSITKEVGMNTARKTEVGHFNAVTSTAATVARAVVTERDVERLRVLFRR